MACSSDISWAEAQEHYRVWWTHEAFGRCGLSVHAPKTGHTPSEPALAELSARGLFIETWCRNEDEARTLLKNAEKWSRDRKVS
jgi:hypothetical protein